jgi:hypothetical protein
MKTSSNTSLIALIGAMLILAPGVAAANSGGHTHKVNCDKPGKTLQKRIDKAHIGDTILVKGTCTENVVISTDGLTIEANGASTITAAGTPGNSAVEVRARNIAIRGFTIVGKLYGIVVVRSGSASIQSNDISGGSSSGVHIAQSSYARVGGENAALGNNIHDNGSGIVVRDSASAGIDFNTITNNGRGIDASDNGSINMTDNLISGSERGLSLGFSANASLPATSSPSGGANTFADNVVAIRCRFGGAASGGLVPVPQIDGGGNGALLDLGPTTGAASCHVSTSLTF